ncbi:MAG: DUF1501 domain-containing protein [Acidobacteria bacterium]|nr:DUF1501 domain-containing protein [Acidobacteriota bacterium]
MSAAVGDPALTKEEQAKASIIVTDIQRHEIGFLVRSVLAEAAAAAPGRRLVVIFQRGAADGLNVVVPHGEKRYYEIRPTIAIPRPSKTADAHDAAIDLDGFFGLHPSLAPLKPVYDAGHLAIVDAAGSPDPTRSHFDAQDYMESGMPGVKATADGWMNRALPPGQGSRSPVRALALGPVLPRSLRGERPAVAVASLRDFRIGNPAASEAFESLYAASSDPALSAQGRETFDAVALLRSIENQPPASRAQYPRGRFGDALRQIAQLIKADGVELAFADIGGWDHHVNEVGQSASQGQLAAVLADFGGSLAAFRQDLGDSMNDVVVVTMSEFGRTARENGNRGTDHGHANAMFVMGGAVRGGKVYGDWPGLQHEQLYEGRDLNLTTDFRDVLGELVTKHLGNRDLAAVFPGHSVRPRGLLA